VKQIGSVLRGSFLGGKDKVQLAFGTGQFPLFQIMDQFWSKIDFSSRSLAFGFYEFAVGERPPNLKL
jgi:hypothetical protein